MHPAPTPEQQELKDAVARFCHDEITPERLRAWQSEPRGIDDTSWRAIADLVYDALRRKRSAAWVAGGNDGADGRTILRGVLILRGEDPAAVFTGDGHAPAPLTAGG